MCFKNGIAHAETGLSWRARQDSGWHRRLELRSGSGDSEHSSHAREERLSSYRTASRSIDALRTRSTEHGRGKFAEDDRMASVTRRTRRSLNEVGDPPLTSPRLTYASSKS